MSARSASSAKVAKKPSRKSINALRALDENLAPITTESFCEEAQILARSIRNEDIEIFKRKLTDPEMAKFMSLVAARLLLDATEVDPRPADSTGEAPRPENLSFPEPFDLTCEARETLGMMRTLRAGIQDVIEEMPGPGADVTNEWLSNVNAEAWYWLDMLKSKIDPLGKALEEYTAKVDAADLQSSRSPARRVTSTRAEA
jgi:hypothetical protein